MTITVSITETEILRAVGDFLDAVLDPSVVIVRGQINRVAEPTKGRGDFVIMWPVGRARLATNIDTKSNDGLIKTALQKTEMTVQLDVHGPNSTDNTQIITTLWRDQYGCAALAPLGISPLYIEGGHQMPFVNGEGQYEERWVLLAHLQADPTVSIVLQSATALDTQVISVDAEYPPVGP